MQRLDLDKAFAPPEPIKWPGGEEQPVRWITWRQQELLTDAAGDEEKLRAAMPEVMVALLPGRTWAEIADTLDASMMRDVVAYCSRAYHAVSAEMEHALGNVPAGTAPLSVPTDPPAPSSPELPASTGVPCGAS
jgi:hypothetical protein